MAAPRSAEPEECFGPLALRRMTKDDGRALLVYAADGPLPHGPLPHGPLPHGPLPGDPLPGDPLPGDPLRGPAGGPGDGAAAAATGDPGHRAAADAPPGGERFDELRGEQVVYAIHRQDRTFLPARDHCPLDATPPGGPLTEIPLPAFEIAVFDNRFPALQSPHGAAEVVVYTDDHDGSFGSLEPGRAEALMWAWRHRWVELGARADVDYVYIFENRGVEVGVTLHHPHGQIYAYPFLPPVPEAELAADARLSGCATCALLAREREAGERIVYESGRVLAYVPYAARWAYEVHVVMAAHRASLAECDDDEMRELAVALQTVVRGYDSLFARPFPYVMAVHQVPTRGRPEDTGHLHVEFYPPLRTREKLKYLAGSEQGAGTFISDTLPEESARALARAIAGGA